MAETAKKQREQIVAHIRDMLHDRLLDKEEDESLAHAHHLYALWCLGHHTELQQHLDAAEIASEFWDKLEHLSPRLNAQFSSPDLGEWDDLPDNIVAECDLLPGDIVVIKQQQTTLWEWHHAGMIKDENTLYSAMYPSHVLEQPIAYYRTHATQLRAFRVKVNHTNAALGEKACRIASQRLGNTYGISDKWFALHNKKAPMYCSLMPWFAWLKAADINLDAHCSDHSTISNRTERIKHLCRIPHTIVYPTNLAESHMDYPAHGFTAKTECVLDLVRTK